LHSGNKENTENEENEMKNRKMWMAALAAGCLMAGVAWGQQYNQQNGSGIGIGLSGFYWHGEDLDDFDLDGFAGIRFMGEGKLGDYLAIQGRIGVAGASADDWGRDMNGRRYEWDYTYTIVPLEVGLMVRLPLGDSGLALYGGPGVGCYVSWHEYEYWEGRHHSEYDDSDVEADFGVWAAAGLRIPLGNGVGIDVQGEYHWLEAEVDWDDIAGDVDINLDGWGFSVGLTVEF
jgi:hypothetical protein